MTDAHDPEKDRHPETPPGYFGWPEGQDSVQFLDENGRPLNRAEWDEIMAEKARRRKARKEGEGNPTG
ncbi:MAG: hypothetical protein M3R38_18100 [Actinomycetota bacterium]|nr:hypothetical protein [Actinomycetota bacterium]